MLIIVQKSYNWRYEKSNAVTTLQAQPNNNSYSRTSITFKPDREILCQSPFSLTTLKMRLQESAYLNANLQLTLCDRPSTEVKITRYHYPQEMPDYLSQINKTRPLINDEVIYIKVILNRI